MIWTSTSKFRPALSIGIKSLLIKNVFQHENTLGKWLHFVPSGYILFPHPTVYLPQGLGTQSYTGDTKPAGGVDRGQCDITKLQP